VLVLILATVLRVLRDVLHVLADVAMISSPQVGKGYHSASKVDNQTHTKVSSSALKALAQPTNQPFNFLSRAFEFLLWATKQNAKSGFCIA
jgi:hypothetical protein